MNKILIALMAFVFLAMVTSVSAYVPSPTLTVISGTVYESDMVTPVSGASVQVDCLHNSVTYTKTTTSSGLGTYSVAFPVSQCDVGDSVTVTATKDDATGSNDGSVTNEGRCIVNTGIVNVSIPEFGVIAGAVALVGALGVFLYRRN